MAKSCRLRSCTHLYPCIATGLKRAGCSDTDRQQPSRRAFEQRSAGEVLELGRAMVRRDVVWCASGTVAIFLKRFAPNPKLCTETNPGFLLRYTVEVQLVPGTRWVCPWDKPGVEGRRAKFFVLKVHLPFAFTKKPLLTLLHRRASVEEAILLRRGRGISTGPQPLRASDVLLDPLEPRNLPFKASITGPISPCV